MDSNTPWNPWNLSKYFIHGQKREEKEAESKEIDIRNLMLLPPSQINK
jgi:hypothetical protein